MTDDLLPCPYCGGAGLQQEDGSVKCSTCEATAPNVDMWNTRTFTARQSPAPYSVAPNPTPDEGVK